MGADVQDTCTGGIKFTDIWELFQCVHADSPPLWIGDLSFVKIRYPGSSGGVTRRFPQANNGAEGGKTGGRDLKSGGSR